MDIKLNMSSYRMTIFNTLDKELRGAMKRVTEDPDLKISIYNDIYDSTMIHTPVYTGALALSPVSSDLACERGHYRNYADGSIDDEGIHYDPYTMHRGGNVEFYADKLVKDGKFTPEEDIESHRAEVVDIVKRYLLSDLREDEMFS